MTETSVQVTVKPNPWPFIGDEFLVENPRRRVRAVFGGRVIADTEAPLSYIEFRHPGALERDRREHQYWMSGISYYFPIADVTMDAFHRSEETLTDPRLGTAHYWTVQVGDRAVDWAAWTWDEPTEAAAPLAGHIVINHRQIDTMFEEDDEIPEGPRNPYHRIDVRNSRRHVRVEFDGVTVAETTRPQMLWETGLPIRYYIPKVDVDLECLRPSELVTSCPYKGSADFVSVDTGIGYHENVAWQYTKLYPEALKLSDTICFWPERGAQVFVDGEHLPEAKAPWPKKLLVKATARTVHQDGSATGD